MAKENPNLGTNIMDFIGLRVHANPWDAIVARTEFAVNRKRRTTANTIIAFKHVVEETIKT